MGEGESLMSDADADDDKAMSLEEFLKYLSERTEAKAEDAGGANFTRWDAHEHEQMLMLQSAGGSVKREVTVPDDTDVFKTVSLKTGLFEGKAIPLYQMPGMKVLEIMLLPHEPVKMMKMVELLTTALSGEREVEMLGMISMHELNEVLSQWVDKSQEAESKDA